MTYAGDWTGIPLAIELAAARVPVLGVHGLHARLNQMFNVLTGGTRMKLRRHQTLRAALEWSYGLLSADEKPHSAAWVCLPAVSPWN